MDILMEIYRCKHNRHGVTLMNLPIREERKEMTLGEALEIINRMFWERHGTWVKVERLDDDSVAIGYERYIGNASLSWGDHQDYNGFYYLFSPESSDKVEQFFQLSFAVSAYTIAFPDLRSATFTSQLEAAQATLA